MKNMLNSKSVNAQTNHRMVVDMTPPWWPLRNQYKALGIKVSYNDIIVRACAKALQDYPIVNASVDGSNILYHDYVNLGCRLRSRRSDRPRHQGRRHHRPYRHRRQVRGAD